MNTFRLKGSSTLFSSDFSSPSGFNQSNFSSHNSSSMSPKKVKKFFRTSPFLPFAIVLVVVIVIAGFGISRLMANGKGSQTVLSANNKTSLDKPTATETLNKSYDFPLKDATGKEVSKLNYIIQSVELRDSIIVKGQQATAIKGRTFLIVNLKITNSYDKSVQLNSKDYIRLIVGSSTEKLAADIHNDPVDVQAISTKYTRLGFPIDENEQSLTLQVGEITGKKDQIKLDLK